MKRLRAEPVKIQVLCFPDENSSGNLERALLRRGITPTPKGSAVYAAMSRTVLKKALPELCEHSERVCIGSYYPELFREHEK